MFWTALLGFLGGGAFVIFLEVQGLHSLLAPYFDLISFLFPKS